MITLHNITKSIADIVLFEDISFKVGEAQKVGFVGPNGAGKTTLLNIIAGIDFPDRGEVQTVREKVGYLPQKIVTYPEEEVRGHLQKFLSDDWEVYKIDEALAKVGLQGLSQRTLISKLSGGQKMKVALAGVLLSEPTALLLDEPTNNLDVKSIAWLEQFVQSFSGKVLVISHDRTFLDTCVNKIIELDPSTHTITEYGGNYSEYKLQKKARHENRVDEYELQQEKEKHMRDWIVQKQEQLKYHPSPKVARHMQAMKKRVEREIDRVRIDKPVTYKTFEIDTFAEPLHQKKSVISLRNFKIYDLLDIRELDIFGQERIHLLGANGSGKTTLVKSILGQIAVHTGSIEVGNDIKIGYFSQEHEALENNDIVLNIFMKNSPELTEARARHILGSFLFTKDKVFSQVKYLSEGEKARLLIALIIHQKNDFLLLDEPTNHLDLESQEVLTQALQEYEGGFLVISHDRYFIEHIQIQRTLSIVSGGEILATLHNSV